MCVYLAGSPAAASATPAHISVGTSLGLPVPRAAPPNIHRDPGPGSYPAKMAPRAARNHSTELNPRMPTEWKGSKPSWEGKTRQTNRKQKQQRWFASGWDLLTGR